MIFHLLTNITKLYKQPVEAFNSVKTSNYNFSKRNYVKDDIKINVTLLADASSTAVGAVIYQTLEG